LKIQRFLSKFAKKNINMNREIYPKVKIIISESMKEAKSFDDVKLRPEHIVLSILMDKENECVSVLEKLKIDPIKELRERELLERIAE
jgi:ATP-dependent Clp protease ATP-binding subunit ClpA